MCSSKHRSIREPGAVTALGRETVPARRRGQGRAPMTNAAESPGPPRSRHVPTERQRRVLRFYRGVRGGPRLRAQRPRYRERGGPERRVQCPLPPPDIEGGWLPELYGRVPRSVRMAGPKAKRRPSAGARERWSGCRSSDRSRRVSRSRLQDRFRIASRRLRRWPARKTGSSS